MKLVGISGSLVGWKTSQAIFDLLSAAKSIDPGVQTELIDLRDYDVEFVRGEPLSFYNDDTWDVVKKIMEADLLVIGTPVFQASISGALKNLLDHLPTDAFKSKVTGIITTGGSDKHYLVADYQLKPILTFLKGIVPSGNVFIHNDAFDEGNEIIDPDVSERLYKLAEEIITLQKLMNQKSETN